MREILFRGKRIDDDAWVYGLPYKAKYGGISGIVDDNENLVVVIPETIGEFTGMTDRNGKKIFEGDIVHVKEFNMRGSLYTDSNYLVNTKFGAWWLSREKQRGNALSVWLCFCEVIGNVHDNPELLKERAEL